MLYNSTDYIFQVSFWNGLEYMESPKIMIILIYIIDGFRLCISYVS